MGGVLYLVPNLLGVVEPGEVLPARTIDIARGLTHWVVETPKPARAFLKMLEPTRPISELVIEPIGEATSLVSISERLRPLSEGHDLGMLSDAGCPGVADPGAALVAAAHRAGHRIVPLVGPSSLLLALMGSGMNGQGFAFHGYLPQKAEPRAAALRRLEADSRAHAMTQLFIETPYRNVAMLEAIVATLAPSTRLCVAVDLTLPEESILTLPVRDWRGSDFGRYHKRPAIFLLEA